MFRHSAIARRTNRCRCFCPWTNPSVNLRKAYCANLKGMKFSSNLFTKPLASTLAILGKTLARSSINWKGTISLPVSRRKEGAGLSLILNTFVLISVEGSRYGEQRIDRMDRSNMESGCRLLDFSTGCTNCYAMRMAHRLRAMGQAKYEGTTRISAGRPKWNGTVRVDNASIGAPRT